MTGFVIEAESSYLFRVLGVIKFQVLDRICSTNGERGQKLVDILSQD